MQFRQLAINGIYRTATNSLIRDFYIPCLSVAVQYDRAVGFFSSSMLVEAAFGLSGLIRNRGRMRLLIGHPLSDEDWAAVKEGDKLSAIHDQLHEHLVSVLERAGSERSVYSLELLSWMVATGCLEIKFAFKKGGMYHEKIGILKDASSERLVFHGSANESANALLPTRNFESLAVYPSWKTEVFNEYAKPFLDGFENLWENQVPDVYSVPVPSRFYKELIEFRHDQHSPPDLNYEAHLHEHVSITAGANTSPSLPGKLGGVPYALRRHQKNALLQWSANSYNGIFALATGSGKTVTALHAATRFVLQGYPLVLVVAVPYQILAEQWVEVMRLFEMEPVKAFYSREQWQEELDRQLSAFRSGVRKLIAVVVVNETLASDTFQRFLDEVPGEKLFFVGDECHHHSSPVWKARIPMTARFRLGMSATPWNPGRNDAKSNLEQLYGPVVATYSLQDALKDGVLCPYTYHWVPVIFEADEAEEYERLSSDIGALIAKDPKQENLSTRTALQSLLARRSRLVGAMRDKLRRLRELLGSVQPRPHTLFYCGEGFHPLEGNDSDGERSVNQTLQILSSCGWKVGRMTAAEAVPERRRILDSFENGVLDAVVAMRVLDEGFDIPTCRTAYLLASSTSYRQHVQRRGRVLRRAPGKRSAAIYDFAALPSPETLSSNPQVWRRQVSTELRRVREFVLLSTNREAEEFTVNARLQKLGLGALYYEEDAVNEEELYGY